MALMAALAASGADVDTYAKRIAPLIEPAKLKTLRERGANPRVQQYVAALAEAKATGVKPSEVAERAVALAGMKGEAASLTAAAMVRNVDLADKLGCLDEAGLADMRRGQAATIRKGPYTNDQLSVDHIIPRAVALELDKTIANLELMPMKLNSGKRDRIGERQLALAKRLRAAGLLSEAGFKAVEARGAEDRKPGAK